jgi:hypothetical protein
LTQVLIEETCFSPTKRFNSVRIFSAFEFNAREQCLTDLLAYVCVSHYLSLTMSSLLCGSTSFSQMLAFDSDINLLFWGQYLLVQPGK